MGAGADFLVATLSKDIRPPCLQDPGSVYPEDAF